MALAPEKSYRNCFPEGGFDAARGSWMVLWTKPRQEKAVARYLDAVDAEFYLPLVRRVRSVRGRRQVSMVPLFPGYVFVAGGREVGYGAVETKRVCQVLEVRDQRGFLDEIEQIQKALAQEGELELYPFAVVGKRCRVKQGPFAGIDGVITDRLGPTRLVLHLAILGQGAALEIEADFLEPVD